MEATTSGRAIVPEVCLFCFFHWHKSLLALNCFS